MTAIKNLGIQLSKYLISEEIKVHYRLADIDPIWALALLPWKAQFEFDVRRFLKKNHMLKGISEPPIQFRDYIRNSRIKIKLSDDKGISTKGLLSAIGVIEKDYKDYLIGIHKSPFGFKVPRGVVSALQDDTGIYYIDNALFTTTSSIALFSGFPVKEIFGDAKNNEKPIAYLYGEYLGRFTGQVGRKLGVHYDQFSPAETVATHDQDVKGDTFFRNMVGGQDLDINAARIVFTIASLFSLARNIRGLGLEAPLFELKISIAALYHGINTIDRIVEDGFCSQEFSVRLLSCIPEEARAEVGMASMRHMRNTLFHYGVKEKQEQSLDQNSPHFGIFEALYKEPGCSVLERYRVMIDDVWENLRSVVELEIKST